MSGIEPDLRPSQGRVRTSSLMLLARFLGVVATSTLSDADAVEAIEAVTMLIATTIEIRNIHFPSLLRRFERLEYPKRDKHRIAKLKTLLDYED